MAVPTKTLYRLEVRPLTLSPWKRVTIWNSKTGKWDTYSLRRGQWYVGHRRKADERVVFAGGPGTNRLNSKAWVDKQAYALKKRGFATRIVAVEYPLYSHLSGDLDADPDVLRALNDVAIELGVKIHVLSGGRTYDEQLFLYQLYLDGRGNVAARPGTSRHETGRAVDGYIDGVPLGRIPAARKEAVSHGFTFPVPDEPWHMEL